MKLFFFDTETTWINPYFDRIIQFGGIFGEYDPENWTFTQRFELNQYINIPGNIPPEASRVHGIYKWKTILWAFCDVFKKLILSLGTM